MGVFLRTPPDGCFCILRTHVKGCFCYTRLQHTCLSEIYQKFQNGYPFHTEIITSEVFCKETFLKKFAKVTGIHLCRSLFFKLSCWLIYDKTFCENSEIINYFREKIHPPVIDASCNIIIDSYTGVFLLLWRYFSEQLFYRMPVKCWITNSGLSFRKFDSKIENQFKWLLRKHLVFRDVLKICLFK